MAAAKVVVMLEKMTEVTEEDRCLLLALLAQLVFVSFRLQLLAL